MSPSVSEFNIFQDESNRQRDNGEEKIEDTGYRTNEYIIVNHFLK